MSGEEGVGRQEGGLDKEGGERREKWKREGLRREGGVSRKSGRSKAGKRAEQAQERMSPQGNEAGLRTHVILRRSRSHWDAQTRAATPEPVHDRLREHAKGGGHQAEVAGSQDATSRKWADGCCRFSGAPTLPGPARLPCPPVNGGFFLPWMMGMDSGEGDRQSRLGQPLPWILSPGDGASFGVLPR